MKKILLAVTGMTPQVVTETLYALAVQAEPWIPDEIHLVTSSEGGKRARLDLLDPERGQFYAFCRDYPPGKEVDFRAENIHVIKDAAGAELDDIRTPENNARASDAIYALVRDATARPDTELHVSIAGGRKTMGFYLGYCLSLCARPQDKLSHVLVSAPFESLTDFYFPPKKPVLLHDRDRQPVHTSEAHVMLAEIPFVRLRDLLPENALGARQSFSDAVAATQSLLEKPRLQIDTAYKTLFCGSRRVPVNLPPQLFALYFWLAQRVQAGLPAIRYSDMSDADKNAFLKIYSMVLNEGEDAENYERARAILFSKNPDDLKEFLEQKRSKINGQIKDKLGKTAAQPYLIATLGPRPQTRYGLTLLAKTIEYGECEQ